MVSSENPDRKPRKMINGTFTQITGYFSWETMKIEDSIKIFWDKQKENKFILKKILQVEGKWYQAET